MQIQRSFTNFATMGNKLHDYVWTAILAGISIGIAAVCNLKGGIYIGALLFAFGLSAVVCSKWRLFTGGIGFVNSWKSFLWILLALAANILGAAMSSCFGYCIGGDAIMMAADNIVDIRISMLEEPLKLILMSAGCGFIMTVSVKHARERQWIPLLFGIPTFVMCGFPHCVADIVYYCNCSSLTVDCLYAWLYTVLGNTIGCNLPTLERFFQKQKI